MTETKIKICGLSRKQDIEYVNAALPDFAGFVFAPSRRQVTQEAAGSLKSSLDDRIKAVGVFVNHKADFIKKLCRQGVIDYIQLHGDETEEYILRLKEDLMAAGCMRPIIKALRVKDSASLKNASGFDTDFLLLDTFSAKEYGGSGRTFDWKIIDNIGKPFFLAGGINCENASAAVSAVQPFCLDVSSGVETEGIKDAEKINKIVNIIRSVK